MSRRADRLFQIVQILRNRRLTTAAFLAETLEVSERTIYRDMQALMVSGVPINGEAGTGYCLESGFDFPPLMFTEEEMVALAVGMQLTQQCTGSSLAFSARQILAKVEAAVPAALQRRIAETKLHVPMAISDEPVRAMLERLRNACESQHMINMDYRDERGVATRRVVRPLGLFFWGSVWTLTAWCELRADFRNFRLDRISELVVSDQRFVNESGKRLQDYATNLGPTGA